MVHRLKAPVRITILYSQFLHPLFFFNNTATSEIYTLSLHDALPISIDVAGIASLTVGQFYYHRDDVGLDRKSTRLNSSHVAISYAVFCLKKKKQEKSTYPYSNQWWIERSIKIILVMLLMYLLF